MKSILTLLILLFSFGVKAKGYAGMFSNNNFNITPLMNAVRQNDEEAVKIFLKSGSNVNEQNIAGVSALHIGAKNDSIDAIKILISYKANIDIRDAELWTPLMRACLGKNSEAAELLVENGANVWLKNRFDESALIHSAMSDCVECLKTIKSNHGTKNNNKDAAIAEINKALAIVYRKENKEMEKILIDLHNDLTGNKPTLPIEDKGKNKKSGKKKEAGKAESVEIKRGVERSTKKIYVFHDKKTED
ncbi:MAG: ankyrin repeat domain-containing protein [Rickettsiales bacterium]|jgi:ankyrin repeat protein|nr:ankyrin repeat domain-containing protein [Rickettsiales bacterium]